jgi:DNA-binding Xre family transcriptional regulator
MLRRQNMDVSYKKLWKRMIDLELDAPDVQSQTKIAPSTFSKMRKNEYVSMDVLVRLCKSLNCQISDIVEVEGIGEKTGFFNGEKTAASKNNNQE